MKSFVCLAAIFVGFGMIGLIGCDGRATAEQKETVRTELKSAEYESCGASVHCKDNLRCFDNVCRRQTRSTVGDYYAALGAQHRAKGDIEEAIASYQNALGQYGAEKVDLPPEIDCQFGAVLALAKAKKEHAELGARVLHRCVLAVPVGSSLRDQALLQLATLAESGLDHMLLGPAKTADLYLTKGPATPKADQVAVTVTATPPPTGKTYGQIPQKITVDLKPALIACWQTYSEASKKTTLTTTIGLKSSYISNDDYEDVPGAYQVKLDPPPNLPPGPDATADACIRAAVEPAIKSLRITDSFTTKLTLTIK